MLSNHLLPLLKCVESSLMLATSIRVFLYLWGRLDHDIISGILKTLYIENAYENAYENAIVAMETQLLTHHLTVMTSPAIRHHEIMYLWIYTWISFVLFDITCKENSRKGSGICIFMLGRSLNAIACAVLTKPHQWPDLEKKWFELHIRQNYSG